MKKTRKLRQSLAISSLIIGGMLLLLPLKTQLLISQSDSLGYSMYLLVKGAKVEKNDVVGIKGFTTEYTHNKHFTKRIIGVAGDRIRVDQSQVWINGYKLVCKAKTKDQQKLTPIVSQVIPAHYYFVVAEHQDSFDSRYQEFGLVKDEYIEGKAYSLW